MPVFGPHLLSIINKYYDNSYDNIGNHDSSVDVHRATVC